jgi:hypothetical protein
MLEPTGQALVEAQAGTPKWQVVPADLLKLATAGIGSYVIQRCPRLARAQSCAQAASQR